MQNYHLVSYTDAELCREYARLIKRHKEVQAEIYALTIEAQLLENSFDAVNHEIQDRKGVFHE